MKKVILLLALAVGFASCEGDQGPPGPPGPPGFDGIAQSFETTLNFSAPDYSNLVVYPNNIEIIEGDMTLVYILFDEIPGNNGGTVDLWRLLPQTLYSDFGEYQYNYDFTSGDATIFLDGPLSTDFTQLTPADLENQTFRIVILPVDFLGQNPGLDVSDYNAVMNAASLGSQDVIEIQS